MAYSLNVTVVPHGPLGYLTIWPTGEDQPVVSTMNSLDGRIKANAAIVPGGNSGAVSVYVSNTTDVVLDIDGYFVAARRRGSSLQFYPLTPCRVLDTRNANGPLGGPYLDERPGARLSGAAKRLAIFPATAAGLLDELHRGAVPGPAAGLPDGVAARAGTRPVVSTLNNLTGDHRGQCAPSYRRARGGEDRGLSHAATRNLVADIDGYFAPAGTGGLSLYPTAPCRVIDTRTGQRPIQRNELTVNVVGSPCAPPSDAQAYVFNATVVPSARWDI